MVGPVVGVFMQNTRVLLVNTDGVFDFIRISSAQVETGIEIRNCALTVTSKSEGVGHETSAVFAEIESMFASMGKLGTSVRDDHLCDRHTPEQRAHVAVVIVSNVIQYDTLAVVETNVELRLGGQRVMYLEVLPFDFAAAEFVTDSLWLNDFQRLESVAHTTIFFRHKSR